MGDDRRMVGVANVVQGVRPLQILSDGLMWYFDQVYSWMLPKTKIGRNSESTGSCSVKMGFNPRAAQVEKM